MKAKLLFVGAAKARVDGDDVKEYNNELNFDGRRIAFEEPVRAVLDMRHKRAQVTVDGVFLGTYMDHVEFQGKEVLVTEVEYHNPLAAIDKEDAGSPKSIEVKGKETRTSRAELDAKRDALRKQEADRKAKEELKKGEVAEENKTKEFNIRATEDSQ